MNPLYSNAHTEQLDRINRDAIAHTSRAAKFGERLNEAKADRIAAEKIFFAELSDESAIALADAQRGVTDLTLVSTAVENGGGLDEVRARYLRTDEVFSVFAKGFAEKADALQKLILPGRKRYAARKALLTEAGIHFMIVENDPHVGELRTYLDRIEGELATAVFGRSYSERREGHEHRSFETLYEQLTRQLPQSPAEPAV